jgi:hypothetical protein
MIESAALPNHTWTHPALPHHPPLNDTPSGTRRRGSVIPLNRVVQRQHVDALAILNVGAHEGRLQV